MTSGDRNLVQPASPDSATSIARHERSPAVPDQKADAFEREAILVIGMHRSGTSVLTHVIEMLGAFAGSPDDLLPADPIDNPAGYWELAELNVAHDEFMAAAGFAWNNLAGFDSKIADPPHIEKFHTRVGHLLAQINGGDKPLVLKDPRIGLMLPLWDDLIDAPAYVIAVRDPREIASSMNQGPRGIYTSHYLLALWEKYMRSALDGLRGRRALFVDYAQLLADPVAQSARLLHGIQTLGVNHLHSPSADALADFIDPKLRRSRPKAQAELSRTQDELFRWLAAQCLNTGPVTVDGYPQESSVENVLGEYRKVLDAQAQRSRNDAISEMATAQAKIEERAAEEHENLLIVQQARRDVEDNFARYKVTSTTEFEHLKREFSIGKRQLETMRSSEAALRGQLAESEHARGLLSTALAGQRLAFESLQREREELAVQRDRVAMQLSQLESEVEVQRSAAALASSRADLRERERSAEIAHAQALARGMHDLRDSLSWRITAPLRALAALGRPKFSWKLEHRLYRMYYAIPGLSTARKRRLILWIHRRIPWLSHNTLSYRLATQTTELEKLRANTPGERTRRVDQAAADALLAEMRTPPLISVVMPVFNVDARWLTAAVDSVRRQFYPHWQLCIADDASTRGETRRALKEIENAADPRIKVKWLRNNLGIAGASNAALSLAQGEYIGLLDNDDELTRDALLEVAREIVARQPDLIYSDEDKLDEENKHVEPHHKPDFSPDYFFSINYICHFAVLSRAVVERIGGFREGYDGAQDYDLLLRASESATKITHIAKVLYHWRKIEGSTASSSSAKPQTSDAGRRALIDSMQRRNIACLVESGPYPNTFRVRRAIDGDPLVSIIVPFRDKSELLQSCIGSVLEKTRYKNFEILCVDNGSEDPSTHAVLRILQARDKRVRVIDYDAPFNYSAVNNFAARHARGEHFVFLNNDTEVIAEEWLDAMLEHSQRPEVGVVGARLWYADGTIQHAGVIAGPGGVAGHAHLFAQGDDPGYFARVRLLQNLSAVTFACAMTRRDVFDQLGGLNERDLTIAFNDVDYCLRARETGFLVVYTPFALLYHYESKSRGYEDTAEKQTRFAAEIKFMQERHHEVLAAGDPYYNRNLSLTASFQPDPHYADELPL